MAVTISSVSNIKNSSLVLYAWPPNPLIIISDACSIAFSYIPCIESGSLSISFITSAIVIGFNLDKSKLDNSISTTSWLSTLYSLAIALTVISISSDSIYTLTLSPK